MKTLNEIITENAKLALEDWADEYGSPLMQKRHERYDVSGCAKRCAEGMLRPEESIRQRLEAYVNDGGMWKADYIEGFAYGMCIPVTRLLSPETSLTQNSKLRGLLLSLERRLNKKEMELLLHRFHRQLDDWGAYKLIGSIADTILKSDTKERATMRVIQLMTKSSHFDPETRRPATPRPPRARKRAKST